MRITSTSSYSQARHGAIIALIAVMLPVLFVLAAFAINLAHIQTVNTETQVAADAAVSAATRAYVLTGSKPEALAAAQLAASRNPIGGIVMPLQMSDLAFGVSLRTSVNDKYSFVPAASGNSIRLTTHTLADSASVPSLFPFMGPIAEIRPRLSATSTQMVVDIVLVVDRSGSMAFSSSETASPTIPPAAAPTGWAFGDPVPMNARWLDLIVAVDAFNTELANSPDIERLALSTYNQASATNVILTTDYTQVRSALDAISLNFIAGGTNVGGGMLEGLAALNDPSFSRPFASKVMIVMTDGNHNTGTWPVDAAYVAVSNGVTIYTVTFSDEANQALMQTVADIGGGEQYHATDAAQLTEAFRQIARRLPTILTK